MYIFPYSLYYITYIKFRTHFEHKAMVVRSWHCAIFKDTTFCSVFIKIMIFPLFFLYKSRPVIGLVTNEIAIFSTSCQLLSLKCANFKIVPWEVPISRTGSWSTGASREVNCVGGTFFASVEICVEKSASAERDPTRKLNLALVLRIFSPSLWSDL